MASTIRLKCTGTLDTVNFIKIFEAPNIHDHCVNTKHATSTDVLSAGRPHIQCGYQGKAHCNNNFNWTPNCGYCINLMRSQPTNKRSHVRGVLIGMRQQLPDWNTKLVCVPVHIHAMHYQRNSAKSTRTVSILVKLGIIYSRLAAQNFKSKQIA